MIKSYPEAIAYLYANLPVFQRVGAIAFKPTLENTLRLCAFLGDPQEQFRCIHVGGTNGKGSSSHMLASILQEAGFKTGLYTSPHLKDFTERIRVNGEEVGHAFVVDFVNRIVPAIEEIKPSFFEITVAMAFDYYARQKVDVAVIEVGLGGRLDSTNIITPVMSLITNIGWDHMDLLGDTLEKIASEKAGIIKQGVPVVISEHTTETAGVFIAKSNEMSAPLAFASDDVQVSIKTKANVLQYSISKNGHVLIDSANLPLPGIYQQKNLAGVWKSVEVLRARGFDLSTDVVMRGLEKVISNTHLKGRWQTLASRPLMVCDTGHNVDGVKYVVDQIQRQQYKHLHVVLGMVKDKDISKVLALFPREATYYFCQADIPRALDAYELAKQASAFGLTGETVPAVREAIAKAKKKASVDDFIFIGGSTFVVAEIENL